MDKKAAKQVSPLTLAFLGDGVFELFVRERLVEKGSAPVNKLHKRAVAVVCAHAQARAVELLEGKLTGEEQEILRRGRNAHSQAPKNADVAEYHSATGLEALFGYLHLCGDSEREKALFDLIWENVSW